MALIEKQVTQNAPSVNEYDEDTQAILKEMSAEGMDVGVAGLDTEPEAPTPVVQPVITDEPEKEEEAEETIDNQPTDTTVSVAEERRSNYWREKANATETALAEAKAALAKFEEKEAFAHVDDRINQIAKDNNVSAKVIKDILTLGKDAFVPPELKQAMEEIRADRQVNQVWDTKFSQFDNEFEMGLLPVLEAENPNITQAEVDKIYAQLGGADRNGPAWADENAKTPLITLYYRLVKGTQPRASGESTKIRSRAGNVSTAGPNGAKPLNEITPQELAGMSDEQFDAYSEGLRGSSLSK